MRVYRFLDAQFGLKSLYERRLKISRIEDLNDPFEFLPFDLTHDIMRNHIESVKANAHSSQGLLCFSSSWSNPLIWAHYSDRHKGLCLGFEIPYGDSVIYKANRAGAMKMKCASGRNWRIKRVCASLILGTSCAYLK